MSSIEELAGLIETRIRDSADRARTQWENPLGTTTRHITIDYLLPNEICQQIYAAFPPNGEGLNYRSDDRERKFTSAKLVELAPILSTITYAIQHDRVVQAIADICDMEKIEPDAKLYAGGVSMMYREHFLNPHIDNSHDAFRKRYRRLNALYYVTPGWGLADGGHLELWDDKATRPVTIESRFNRLVIMETNRTSLHSVSPVVAEGPRCCVSSYYFSEESPDKSDYFHVTSFNGRPGEKMKRLLSPLDNALRQAVASMFGLGRGRGDMNEPDATPRP